MKEKSNTSLNSKVEQETFHKRIVIQKSFAGKNKLKNAVAIKKKKRIIPENQVFGL